MSDKERRALERALAQGEGVEDQLHRLNVRAGRCGRGMSACPCGGRKRFFFSFTSTWGAYESGKWSLDDLDDPRVFMVFNCASIHVLPDHGWAPYEVTWSNPYREDQSGGPYFRSHHNEERHPNGWVQSDKIHPEVYQKWQNFERMLRRKSTEGRLISINDWDERWRMEPRHLPGVGPDIFYEHSLETRIHREAVRRGWEAENVHWPVYMVLAEMWMEKGHECYDCGERMKPRLSL